MGKRSEGFERSPKDFYRTWQRKAVLPLMPHLEPRTRFVEPCAGDGVLVDHLVALGHKCVLASDIEPQRGDIKRGDALQLRWDNPGRDDRWITNPPWTREIMQPLIEHLCRQAPGWFLFDADWVHTDQSIPLLPMLRKIVSVGRLRWIEGSAADGKDNSAWHLFDGTRPPTFIEFIGPLPG